MNEQWEMLRNYAEIYHDIQKSRVACGNRAMRTPETGAVLESLAATEKLAAISMRKAYRACAPSPVVEWQNATVGIGEHLLARLLGVIGHPLFTYRYWWEGEGENRQLMKEPDMYERSVCVLRAYCGHGDPERRPRKGMSAVSAAECGNPRAKMLVHLLAESCMKQRNSPYRDEYERKRKEYAERDWTPGHQHNAALRKVGKDILRDLWLAAKEEEFLAYR